MVRVSREPATIEALPATSDVGRHAHGVLVHSSEGDFTRKLEAFLEGVVAKGNLAVFLHAMPDAHEAARFFERAAPPGVHLGLEGPLRLHHVAEAVEADGEPREAELVAFLEAMLSEAKARGRRGVRVLLDARDYVGGDAGAAWLSLESALGPELHAEAGLVCAVPASALERPGVDRVVFENHGFRYRPPSLRRPPRRR